MFCMAWFMELSRLSNSLGSVCSQRRGRLAAVAGCPRLPRSLSHHSPLFPSLQSCWSVCLCVCVSVSLCTQAPPADLRGVLCLLVLNAALRPPTLAWSPTGCQNQQRRTTQWSSVSRTLACSHSSHSLILLRTPNLRSEGGCGTRPSECAHCFTSCPVWHTPRRLCPTGS